MNAIELYNLLSESGVRGATGRITFTLNGQSVSIKSKDSVGNLIQNWLKSWMELNSISFEENANSQTFPDFNLNPEDPKTDLLEVKSFDKKRGPGFDLANFDSYCNSLLTSAYRLDSDYLIFAYSMDLHGEIKIEDIWLKKIWEISGPSGTYPIKVQEKKNIIYNLRPCIWFSERSTYKPFPDRKTFVNQLNETRYQYPPTRASNGHWLTKVRENYKLHTGRDL